MTNMLTSITLAKNLRTGVARLAYSSDGKSIASALLGGAVMILDAAKGDVKNYVRYGDAPSALVASPLGDRFAAAIPGRLQMIDTKVATCDPKPSWEKHITTGYVSSSSLACSSDGKQIVMGMQGWNGKDLFMLDAETGALKWRADAGNVTAVACSPDGTRVAAANTRNELIMLRAEDGKEISSRKTISNDHIDQLCFSPDGLHLATAHALGVGMILEAQSFKQLLHIALGTHVTNLAYTPDDTKLLGTRWQPHTLYPKKAWAGESVFAFDPKTGAELSRTNFDFDKFGALAISPDGTELVFGTQGGSIEVWGPLDVEPIIVQG